nr:MAG TPA: hypothetical protein [Caudoviricetes sp.]
MVGNGQGIGKNQTCKTSGNKFIFISHIGFFLVSD